MIGSKRTTTHRRFERELSRLRAESLHRRLDATKNPDFSSNDYLELSRHPELVAATAAAVVSSTQVASTGSRLLSGHRRDWEALEAQFARFAGTESALYFSSGYAANVGMLAAVVRPEDTVYSDALNHASLIDGIRLAGSRKVIFPHLDLDFLESTLARNDDAGERFIVVESLFSMEGDRAPIDDLAALAERYGAGLIVDEAHATGVYGPAGRGLIPDAVRSSELLVAAVYTCGKALASPGAFVAGSGDMVDFLVNTARTFIFSTALPPYVAAQVATAIRLAAGADDARRRVLEQARRLRKGLSDEGIRTGNSVSQIVPVMIGSSEDAVAASERLRDTGFAIRPIRPPTVPDGTARLRLSVTADTSTTAVDTLVDAIARIHRT